MQQTEREVAQSCPTLCDTMDCSLPGSSTHGILQTRTLEWVAISFSRRPSWPRDWTRVSHIVGRRFTIWATRKVLNRLVIVNITSRSKPFTHEDQEYRRPCILNQMDTFNNLKVWLTRELWKNKTQNFHLRPQFQRDQCFFSLLLFSCSVMPKSLWPHEPQHTRLPRPSVSPGVFSNSCPLSRYCHPTITSSVAPFSFCLQSFPASWYFLFFF